MTSFTKPTVTQQLLGNPNGQGSNDRQEKTIFLVCRQMGGQGRRNKCQPWSLPGFGKAGNRAWSVSYGAAASDSFPEIVPMVEVPIVW
jgi:hypothetical protein